MYKKAWCTCKVVVLRNKPIAFLTSSLPSPSSLLKLPVFGATTTSTGRDIIICAILRMLLLTTLPSFSRGRRETGLFGVVARTWVVNFHFNQVWCVLKPEFCRLSFFFCPYFFESHFKLDFQALLSKLTSFIMFLCFMSQSQDAIWSNMANSKP